LLPGNESRIVRHGTAQQTVVLAKEYQVKARYQVRANALLDATRLNQRGGKG